MIINSNSKSSSNSSSTSSSRVMWMLDAYPPGESMERPFPHPPLNLSAHVEIPTLFTLCLASREPLVFFFHFLSWLFLLRAGY